MLGLKTFTTTRNQMEILEKTFSQFLVAALLGAVSGPSWKLPEGGGQGFLLCSRALCDPWTTGPNLSRLLCHAVELQPWTLWALPSRPLHCEDPRAFGSFLQIWEAVTELNERCTVNKMSVPEPQPE